MRPDRLLEPRKDAVLGLKMVRKMLLENELQDHDAPCCKGRSERCIDDESMLLLLLLNQSTMAAVASLKGALR